METQTEQTQLKLEWRLCLALWLILFNPSPTSEKPFVVIQVPNFGGGVGEALFLTICPSLSSNIPVLNSEDKECKQDVTLKPEQ